MWIFATPFSTPAPQNRPKTAKKGTFCLLIASKNWSFPKIGCRCGFLLHHYLHRPQKKALCPRKVPILGLKLPKKRNNSLFLTLKCKKCIFWCGSLRGLLHTSEFSSLDARKRNKKRRQTCAAPFFSFRATKQGIRFVEQVFRAPFHSLPPKPTPLLYARFEGLVDAMRGGSGGAKMKEGGKPDYNQKRVKIVGEKRIAMFAARKKKREPKRQGLLNSLL